MYQGLIYFFYRGEYMIYIKPKSDTNPFFSLAVLNPVKMVPQQDDTWKYDNKVIITNEELIYTKIFNPDGKRGLSPFEVIEIPYYKLSKYPKYEINVLKIMNIHKNDYPKGFTIEDLLKLKNEEIDERSNKIKLNHYLTELEKHSLIESNPINRKKYVKIQKSGEIFLKTIASLIEN